MPSARWPSPEPCRGQALRITVRVVNDLGSRRAFSNAPSPHFYFVLANKRQWFRVSAGRTGDGIGVRTVVPASLR